MNLGCSLDVWMKVCKCRTGIVCVWRRSVIGRLDRLFAREHRVYASDNDVQVKDIKTVYW